MQQTLTNGDTIYSADIDEIDYTHVTDSIITHHDGRIDYYRATLPLMNSEEVKIK